MKPLNNDNPGCNPISSNCVIWQGPNIPCISLCKGDTVSDVIYKLATELCEVLETLNIDTYDITCFNLGTASPTDFQGLIQYLIARACNTPTGVSPNNNNVQASFNSASGQSCPDCTVNIAPCFYYQNEVGDTITTMQLIDYVTAIGNRMCTLVQAITQIQQTLAAYNIRITTLENAPPPVINIPQVTPVCVLPSVATDVNIVVTALEQQFCQLIGATGTSQNIYDAIVKQCVGLASSQTLAGTGATMGSLPGWSNTVNNLAAALGNMWLTICDLRSAVATIQTNCCPTGCSDITLNLQGELVGDNLTLYINGNVPVGFVQCNPSGTLVTITDQSGHTITTYINLIAGLNSILGFAIALGGTIINTNDNLTIHMEPCLSNGDTGAVCQSVLETMVINIANCPILMYTPTADNIAYTGTGLTGTFTYTIELWDNAGLTLISTNIQSVTGPNPIAGSFISLTQGTTYKIRVRVNINGSLTDCPFTAVTTLTIPCLPADTVSANITIP